MSQSKLASFPKFPHLANELQDLVWEWSVKDRPGSAHFAQLGSQKLKSRRPDGDFVSFLTTTMIEELTWCKPPPELVELCPRRETHLDVLLQTCKQSRRIATRHRNLWGPEGTLQIYDPRDEDRAHTWDFARDFNRDPPQVNPSRGSYHFKFLPPRLFDLPSRHLDNSRDLVILGQEWIGVGKEFQQLTVFTKSDWRVPVPRVPYLALSYTTHFEESLDSQLAVITAFLRLRAEVLYILINPDELDGDDTVVDTDEARKKVKDRRRVLETPFPKRPGAENLVAAAPDSFWYGPREYYALSWDDLEEKMMGSARWRRFTSAIEKARQMKKSYCLECMDVDCETRAETYPAIWKVMSWRDHGKGNTDGKGVETREHSFNHGT
ncbi:hypothetical protein Neosp_007228 [[Neocosmospora] mangrovei]